MQSINASQLLNLRNPQYGWPTMYPSPKPNLTI